MTNQYFKDIVSPLVESIGKGALRKSSKIFNFYCEVQGRLEYLLKIRSDFRTREDNTHFSKKLDEDFTSRSVQFKLHLDFVRETCALLDINNTIDHPIVGTDLEDIYRDWQDYKTYYPKYVLDAMFDVPVSKGTFFDGVAQMLLEGQAQMRKGMYLQRLKNEVELRHGQGWFMVFDTLTLAPDQISSFVENQNVIRDYCRKVGRLVNRALGLRAKDSYSLTYKYFIVPEYGDKNGRLHFHCLHLMRALPLGTTDPNINRKVRNRRIIESMRGLWDYGYSMPIAVRYHGDSFTRRLGWLHPVDGNGVPLTLKPVDAVIYYISKYVVKNSDVKKAHNVKRSKNKWSITLKQHRLALATQRVSMSRGFGMTLNPMDKLPLHSLRELTMLHWSVTPKALLLKENARRMLASKLGAIKLPDLIAVLPQTTNMLAILRTLTQKTPIHNLANSIELNRPSLTLMDISKETLEYLRNGDYYHKPKPRFNETYGTK